MNHKRGRSRNRRAGCKFCKPWKVNGYRTEKEDGKRFSDHRRRNAATKEIECFQGNVAIEAINLPGVQNQTGTYYDDKNVTFT